MHRAYSLLLTLFITTSLAWGQNSVRYWFDQQLEKQMLSGSEIDCSALSTGVHFAHFQISGVDGNLSPVRSKAFLVMNEEVQQVSDYRKMSYWFDQQATKQELNRGSSEIDCSALPTGMHFAHFQIEGTDGLLSPVRSQAFLVLNENLTPSSSYSAINYWFDQQTVKTAYTSGSIDCSALSNGIHAVHFQLVDDNGLPCPVKTQFFVNLDFAAHQLYYWFDDETTRNLMAIDGTEISVEGLTNGPHTLHAMLADAKGNVLSAEVKDANFTIICSDDDHVDADADGACDVCHELITYTRSGLTEGNYGTLCLPKGGTASGATIYSIAGKRVDIITSNPISLVLEEVTTLEPGKPYVFCAESENLTVTYSGLDISTEALSENGLIGNFTSEKDVPEGKYLLYDNKLVKCGTGCKINANRAYVDMDEVPTYGSSPSPLTRSITIYNGTTGINLIESSEDEAQIFTPAGMRIPRTTKGIMIINGNKVINQ